MAIDNKFEVRKIALVKFKTPMYCKTAGGLLNDRNDTHWGVLINDLVLIHMADGAVIKESWAPNSGHSPTPCQPYTFLSAPRTFTLNSINFEVCNTCHDVCKLIFKAVQIEILVSLWLVTRYKMINYCVFCSDRR